MDENVTEITDQAKVQRPNVQISERLQQIRNIGLENMKKAQKRMKEAFWKRQLKKRKLVRYCVNDKVWLLNRRKTSRKGGSLESNWLGPYIIEKLSGKVVTLKNLKGMTLKKKYNTDHLKPFVKKSKPSTHHMEPSEQETAKSIKTEDAMVTKEQGRTPEKEIVEVQVKCCKLLCG